MNMELIIYWKLCALISVLKYLCHKESVKQIQKWECYTMVLTLKDIESNNFEVYQDVNSVLYVTHVQL